MKVARVLWVVLMLAGCVRFGYRGRRDLDDAAPDGHAPVDLVQLDPERRDESCAVEGSVPDVPAADTTVDVAPIDAALPDGFTCPTVCSGGCTAGVCLIKGSGNPVSCPPDLPCQVSCLGEGDCPKAITCGQGPCLVTCGGTGADNQCAAAIDCSQAASCTIHCLGSNSCAAKISCGVGPCTVVCGSLGSQGQCAAIVDCAQSCGCDVTCDGLSSCGSVVCPVGCKTPNAEGCTLTSPGCQSCP